MLHTGTRALPENFWDGTDLDTAVRLLRASPTLPASDQIARRVIEAQLPPPSIPSEQQIGAFFLARVDQLIADGALPSARVLLQGAGPDNAATFQRLFDLALLLGGEGEVCNRMNTAPGIAPNPTARIFCLAQAGDVRAADALDAWFDVFSAHYLSMRRQQPVPLDSPVHQRLYAVLAA